MGCVKSCVPVLFCLFGRSLTAPLGTMPPLSAISGLPSLPSSGSLSTVPLCSGHTTLTPVTAASAPLGTLSSADQLTNLLPWSLSAAPTDRSCGVYVGEGLPPVPLKLADRIRRHEFIDMAEMLPEFWPMAKSEEGEPKKGGPRKLKQITEFHTWLQCFAVYCSVLGSHDPACVPELMAYLITIARVSQDYTGLAWVRYDAAFRRQAAITGNRKWSQINPSLYSICFTGRAQEIKRCELCLSTAHPVNQCPLQAEADPELPTRVKAVESAVLTLASRSQASGWHPRPPGEVCRLWNANNCRFARCRYRHACSICGDPHPATACPRKPSASGTPTEGRPPLPSRQARREANNPY